MSKAIEVDERVAPERTRVECVSTIQFSRGVVRCFVDAQDLRRLLANMAAAELVGVIIQSELAEAARRALR
jgi:hypothetical protein